MRNYSTDDRILEESEQYTSPPSRNPDSSLDPQYEDSVAPDRFQDDEAS